MSDPAAPAAPAVPGAAPALTPAQLRELDVQGYVVVPGVFTPEDCAALRAGLCADIKAWTAGEVDLTDPSTWAKWRKYFPMHSMLVQHGGLGRALTAENIRFDKRVADVFAALHGVSREHLLTSFDALSVHVPGERVVGGEGRGFFRAPWLHTDQGPDTKGIKHAGGGVPDYCVQGQVVLETTRAVDATLMVLPGSHKLAEEFFKAFPPKDPYMDWQQLTHPLQEKWFEERGCVRTRVAAPEGSMVLWNSSTVHCGVEPERGRPAPYPVRQVVYVCMLPRPAPGTKGLAKLLERRRRTYEQARVSSHHPLRPRTFPLNPRTYGAAVPVVVPPTVGRLCDLPPDARALVDGGPAYAEEVAATHAGAKKGKPARKRSSPGGEVVSASASASDSEPELVADPEVPMAYRKRRCGGGGAAGAGAVIVIDSDEDDQ